MFLPAGSKLIFLLTFFCDVPLPSQVFGMTANPVIQNVIDIDSTKIYIIYSHNTSWSSQAPVWIYSEWMWSHDSISANPSPYMWIVEDSTSPTLEPGDLKDISGGTLILGPPDSHF